MNIFIVSHVLGTLVLAAGAAMFLPLAFAACVGENGAFAAFLVAMSLSLIVAFELKNRPTYSLSHLSVREGIAITGLGWLLVSFLGMLPYIFGGYMNLLDAFTESVSGFSGTGATVLADIESLPKSVLLWRSLTGWVGGLGIIVIFMAILPQTGKSGLFLFRAESSGERQLPKIRGQAKALFTVYFILTAFCTATYVLCGMDLFSAVNHAFTTIATSGFSLYNDGIIGYHSFALEMCMAFFMVAASLSFSLYLATWQRGLKRIVLDTQLKSYLVMLTVAATLVFIDLTTEGGMDVVTAFRRAVFHVASISSTTAYVTHDFDSWPPFAKIILLMLMFVGGCAGSTSGGLKMSRVVLLIKSVQAILQKKFHPQTLPTVKMNGQIVSDETLRGVARYFFAYVLTDIFFALVMIIDGIPLGDAVAVSISTLGSIGPGFGLAGAMSTYELLPPMSKIAACFVMFLGRLEIFTVLVMFTPEFWRRKKGW